MSFLAEVAVERRRAVKENPVARGILAFLSGRTVSTPRSYDSFAREGYQENATVYAAINLVTQSAAGIPWLLSRTRGSQRTELESHPLLDLLARPNPEQSLGAWIESVLGYLLMSGNSYIAGAGPSGGENRGQFRELWPTRPDRMRIVAGTPAERIARYEYAVSGQTMKMDPATVLHLKLWHPRDDWYGLSPLEAASCGVDQMNYAATWNAQLMQNSASPAGVLSTDKDLTQPQRDAINEQFQAEKAGPENAGRLFVLDGGLKWQQMGLSPKDADWVNARKLTLREIASVFRVPAQLLGDAETTTYANYQEARRALYMEAVLPWMDRLRDELNRWLAPRYGDGLYLDYDRDEIEALQEERSATWTRVQSADWLTVDEKRRATGYDDLPGGTGDVVLVSAAVLPLGAQLESMYIQPAADQPTADGAAKTLNVTTDEQKAAYWKAFERQRLPLYAAARKQFRARFATEREAVLAAVRGATPQMAAGAMTAVLAEQRGPWMTTLTAVYLAAGQPFARRVFDAMKQIRPAEVKADVGVWESVVIKWLQAHGLEKIDLLLAGTKRNIINIIQSGIAEGLSTEQIAKEIQTVYGSEYALWRAERLARTEVVAASNLGAMAGAAATGLPLVKHWLATRDNRTREDHRRADGQTVPQDAAFDVGADHLQFPGDTSLGASSEETINCRCTVTFSVAR